MGCNTSTEIASNANVSKLEAQLEQDIQDAKNVDQLTQQIERLMRVSIVADDAKIQPASSIDHIILDIISDWDWENTYASQDESNSDEEQMIEC